MIEKLSSSLGRKDQGPNIELAETLARKKDRKGIAEIARALESGDPAIASDCLKVLYEIGYRDPGLVAEYAELFVKLLGSRDNRLVWGAAIALAAVAGLRSELLFSELPAITKAYEMGSVITVDNCVSIFASLCKAKKAYERRLFPLLISHLETCRPKEVAQHAERAFACVNKGNAEEFRSVIARRSKALGAPQRKRLDKLLRRIEEEVLGRHRQLSTTR